jgi:hypothetical protein
MSNTEAAGTGGPSGARAPIAENGDALPATTTGDCTVATDGTAGGTAATCALSPCVTSRCWVAANGGLAADAASPAGTLVAGAATDATASAG